MKVAQHRFSAFHLTRVSMSAGESYFIPAAENDISIGVICTKGGTEHRPSGPAVHLPQVGEGLLLNDGATAWSNDAVGHNDLNLYAPVDTEWVCVGENGHGRPELSMAHSVGSLAIPAGTGVIVVSGSFSLDGITGGPDGYFRPRSGGVTLSGVGDVILVHPV
jgi:hypothetical protein